MDESVKDLANRLAARIISESLDQKEFLEIANHLTNIFQEKHLQILIKEYDLEYRKENAK